MNLKLQNLINHHAIAACTQKNVQMEIMNGCQQSGIVDQE